MNDRNKRDADPIDWHEQYVRASREIERAFSVLAAYGVPRGRAGDVANGIEVLVTRMEKEMQARAAGDMKAGDPLPPGLARQAE